MPALTTTVQQENEMDASPLLISACDVTSENPQTQPFARLLARLNRDQLAVIATVAINMLDDMEGDCDLEDDDPAEEEDPCGQADEDELNTCTPAPIGLCLSNLHDLDFPDWDIDQTRGPLPFNPAADRRVLQPHRDFIRRTRCRPVSRHARARPHAWRLPTW